MRFESGCTAFDPKLNTHGASSSAGDIAQMAAVPPSEQKSEPSSFSRTESDILILDAHTFKDLEVFESQTGETSLFQLCNSSRSAGGAKVLRRRMRHPWSSADLIRATQESLTFILSQRQAFTAQPSAWLTSSAEHYLRGPFPVVPYENWLLFGLGAFAMRTNHHRYYFKIESGVQVTCTTIRMIRRFVDQADLRSPVGELAPLFEEIRELLARPNLSQVPDENAIVRTWKILRLDQIFRDQEKATVHRLVELIYEIDALVSMADVHHEYGFVLPRIEKGPLSVHAEDLVHPFVQNAVANPAELNQERRVLFLTGPNMAGKTTYLRALATALYFAHLGMGVPAKSFGFVPAQRLFSSFSLNDDLRHGVSYFRAEAIRVKAVAQAVAEGYRVVAFMDEPFKGTNVKDAFDASLAILLRFAAKEDCLFMFSSHLIELGEQLSGTRQIDRRYFAAEESEGRLRFDFLLHRGVSSQRLGMRVLHEEGIFSLLDGNSKPA
jgi:DNA mismatch repair protein MutS